MKPQRQNGIISTINFSPFYDTADCFSLRDSLFNEAIMWGNGVRKSISPHFPVAKE